VILATFFVVDQFLGAEMGQELFPFLHHKYTRNFGFRGLWAECIITGILFLVSAFTEKTAFHKLETTTIKYPIKMAKFSGITDWRLHLGLLSIVTVLLYIWLS
jgi:SSS family solute:Na+ symporter